MCTYNRKTFTGFNFQMNSSKKCFEAFFFAGICPGQEVKRYPISVRLDNRKVFLYTRSLTKLILSAFFVVYIYYIQFSTL